MLNTQTKTQRLSRTGRASEQRCPKCGSTLLINDYGQTWCSFVGGVDIRPCSFGIEHDESCDQRVTVVADCACGYAEANRDKVYE